MDTIYTWNDVSGINCLEMIQSLPQNSNNSKGPSHFSSNFPPFLIFRMNSMLRYCDILVMYLSQLILLYRMLGNDWERCNIMQRVLLASRISVDYLAAVLQKSLDH